MDNKILVPTDFTKVGDTALDHAIVVGKATNSDVYMLHVVTSKKEFASATEKMNELVSRIKDEKGVDVHPVIRIGTIFEDIDKVATEIKASLIIMGTHGLTGMQFITGSRALKIVTEASVPFIIVQEKGIKENGYDKIVVPLDLHKETKQKLNLIANMAKYFESEIFLISPGETDEYLKNQLDRNITYAKQFLEDNGIKYNVEIAESKSSGFVKSVIKYAVSIDADLIGIMNFYENGLMSMIGGGYEQQIITNEAQIAALCVNPIETHVISGTPFSN